LKTLQYLSSLFLLALSYFAAAHLVSDSGLHSQIVPLWIPAGVGLAAVIHFGAKMVPGVFLGCFAYNATFQNTSLADYDLSYIATAIIIASGATLQTLLGAYLIKRFGAHPIQPSSYRGLFKFMLWAGFATCMVNATIGTSAIYFFTDSSGNSGFLLDWLSWWMGDTFGSIVVTPLLLCLFGCSQIDNLQRRAFILAQLAVLVVSILILNKIFLNHLDQQVRRGFEQDVKILDAQLQATIQQNFADLAMLEGVLTAGHLTEPALFRERVLDIQTNNASVLAYSWDPVVPQFQRAEFEQLTARLLDRSDYKVRGESLGEADPLIPVQFVEPIETNTAALGFNLLSLEDRRAWVLKSQESGRPVATQILHLTQAPNEPGLLILHPVYISADEASLLTRNKRLAGFMVGVFTVERMFNSTLIDAGVQHIHFKLYELDEKIPFYQTASSLQNPHGLTSQFTLEIAQNRWRVEAEAGPDYIAMHPFSNANLMQSLLVILGCMGTFLILHMNDRERLLIQQVQRQTESLAHQARHDVLTGLPNRYHLQNRVAQRISNDKEQVFSLLFIDLDRFKVVNDSLGHQAGDQLLQALSSHLQSHLVGDCELFRTGGDEFILIVGGELSRAKLEAERFLGLCTLPHSIDGHHFQLTASIGVSVFPEHGVDLDTLIKHADTAMYRAKAQGKNCYELYNPLQTEETLHAFQMEQDLRLALAHDQLLLHYQPQFSLTNQSLCGLEVLVRWQHPEKGMMPPGQFIPLAEETNLIIPLGWLVIEKTCQQILSWQEQNLMVPPVAVNISPKQLMETDFLQHLNQLLGQHGIAHEQIELEITESLILQDPENVIQRLNTLQAAGYRLALDDFGTGYSSLSRLKQIPLDRLKIDYSFTRDIGKDPKDEAIILTVIALGKSLNIEVLAEGVETQEQYLFLKHHGCDSVQGYLLGYPVASEDLTLPNELVATKGSV